MHDLSLSRYSPGSFLFYVFHCLPWISSSFGFKSLELLVCGSGRILYSAFLEGTGWGLWLLLEAGEFGRCLLYLVCLLVC